MIARAIFNKSPLPPNRFAPLPLGAVQPQGWLDAQIQGQAEALERDLALRFPGVEGDSAWLGGSLDDGERAPEALASLTVIAYTSGREALKEVVARFVSWAVASQTSQGDFGPAGCGWWPKMLMLRVMRQYFMATGDKEPLKTMDRFFRFQLETLPTQPLTGKACARAAENMLCALWLYNLTEQKHLLRLCELLAAQTLDWTDEMHIFPHIRDMARQRPWGALREGLVREGELNGLNQRVSGRDYHLTQAVDVAFGLKTPGVINLFKSGFKEVSALRTAWPKYMKQHGVALSMFTGDDHLAGADPARGVNLCAVAETLQSLMALMAMGEEQDRQLGDLFEKIALNAPLAAWDREGRTRQALLQVNQLSATPGPHGFYNAPEGALPFRVRPLDLADQALAAYASGLCYATSDGGLGLMGYAPCSVHFVAGGERVRLTVEGGYPFSGKVLVRVETRAAADFPVYLRIPGWAGQVMLKLPDGEWMQMQGGETACVRRRWAGEAAIEMDLNLQPRISRWFHQSAAVELGPLLMALDLDKEQTWNWALDLGQPMKTVLDPGQGKRPKEEESLSRVLVKAAPVQAWTREGEDCAPPPIAPQVGGEERVLTLTPFGATGRRVAQFPVLREEER